MMTQLELIETLKTLPVEQLPELKQIIDSRLGHLSEEAEVIDESHLTIIPTPEQSAELDRLIAARKRGELEMIPFNKAMAELRARYNA